MSIANPRNAREANYLALAATPEEIVERVLLLIAQQQQSVNLSTAAAVSGTLPVANGGTSVATLTAHGVLVGEGTSAVVGVTGATGQVLHAVTGADPTFSAVSLTADITGVLAETHGGTNQSSYALGDTLYASAVNTISKLAGNIVNTRKFLRQTGTGAVSAAPTWDTILAADVPGSALTKTDDTNVTLTLGGAPTTALLNAASITAGWTGTLAVARGGTGNGALAALTKTDDTNVTMTLGGSPTTALVNAASLTLGWTGQLGLTRGGTAASLTASNGGIVYSTASAFAILSGTATGGQILRSGASTTPAWSTPTFPNTATANKALVGDGTNVVLSTPTIPLTSSPTSGKIMIGDGTNWVASTPTWPTAAGSAKNVPRSDGTNFVAAQLAVTDLSTGTLGSGASIAMADSGTFTPTIVGGTTAGAGTYTNQQGNYTRVGNRCFFNCRVTWTATTGTGNMLIGGLPFTSNSGANTHNTLSIWFNGNIALDTGYAALVVPNDNRAFIYGYQSGTGVANLAIQATGDIVLTGSFLL